MQESGSATRTDLEERMNPLLEEVSGNPMLWLPVFVPAVFVVAELASDTHTLG